MRDPVQAWLVRMKCKRLIAIVDESGPYKRITR